MTDEVVDEWMLLVLEKRLFNAVTTIVCVNRFPGLNNWQVHISRMGPSD